MDIEIFKKEIRFAVSSITGRDSITASYGKSVMACFGFFDEENNYIQKASDSVIMSTLKKAPMAYCGSKTFPEPNFWKQLKRNSQRDENVNKGKTTYEYNEATDEERDAIAEHANRIALDFESKTKSYRDDERPSLYTAKVKRYKQYVTDKLVRVDDDTHVLHSQWILREQALQQSLNYHCPVEWLERREIIFVQPK